MKFKYVIVILCIIFNLIGTANEVHSRRLNVDLSRDVVEKDDIRILRGGDYRKHFWNNLEEADTRVWISTYSITGPRSRMMSSFYEEMIKKSDTEGVDVRLLLPGKLDDSREVARKLKDQFDFPVRLYEGDGLLHAKFIIIDEKKIYNGSANLTLTAFNRPYETSIYFESKELMPEFEEFYREIWKKAR